MASDKTLWLGPSDKLLFKKQDRTTAVTLDGSAAALGCALPLVLKNTQTVNPGSVAADDQLEISLTITGAAAGDSVLVIPPVGLDAGLMCFAFVSAADTVKLRILNSTAAPIDPASASWSFHVLKA